MATGLLRKPLAITNREVTFQTRGFPLAEMEKRLRLEGIGRIFIDGYQNALEFGGEDLEERLRRVALEDRGFAFEGAAMAMAIQDAMLPFQRRLKSWVAGPGQPHEYMTYVGAGCAIARIPWYRVRAERCARRMHRFLWPLAIEGFGFHEGYSRAEDLAAVSKPRGLDTDVGRSAYDQGLGRSFWFICGADPWKIAELIARYDAIRRRDLWTGVGLACAYVGGVAAEEVRILARLAGAFAAGAGQGACFAAKARMRAGNPAAHTEMACQVLCGMSATEAARLSDQTYSVAVDLAGNYRDWCTLLQAKLAGASALGK